MAENFIITKDIEYPVLKKNITDIIADLNNRNEDDDLITKSIIESLEKNMADHIKKGYIVQIPLIGTIRRSITAVAISDKSNKLSEFRKISTIEEYKNKVREVINNAKLEEKNKVLRNKRFAKIKRKNKKLYESLLMTINKEYATLKIYSIMWLREVPFNIEVEEAYRNIYNNK